MYKEGCAKLNRSPFGCSRSSTGSIPGILPNIVHTVLYCSVKNPGRRTDLPSTWVQKEVFKKIMFKETVPQDYQVLT